MSWGLFFQILLLVLIVAVVFQVVGEGLIDHYYKIKYSLTSVAFSALKTKRDE